MSSLQFHVKSLTARSSLAVRGVTVRVTVQLMKCLLATGLVVLLFESSGRAAAAEPPPGTGIKAMRLLGTNVQRARACGLAESQMQGAFTLYSANIQMASAIKASAAMPSNARQSMPKPSDLTGAFLQGAETVVREPPSAESCALVAQHWGEIERTRNEQAHAVLATLKQLQETERRLSASETRAR